MLERPDGRTASSRMTDKEAFTARCRAANLSVVPIFLVVSRDGVRLPAGVQAGDRHPTGLPERDLFFKPIASSIMSTDSTEALGAARWDYLGEGRFKGQGGEILTADELLNRARGLCTVTDYLIQPRLQNHPGIADLSNGALSSVTIQTFLDERNRPEVLAAVFHLAVGRNTLADNVSLGGLVAAIDIETGTLGPATDSGKRPEVGWRDVHPDTGGQIAGRTLPIWQAALDLARPAHAAFPERIVVGWDMALTADGPLLIGR